MMARSSFRLFLRNCEKFIGGTPEVGILPRNQTKFWNSTAAISEVKNTEKNDNMKLSKAMKAYQERADAYDKFMFEQIGEYEIGKRHLANIMGEDPETFTQEDIDEAIKYLLPSGLFEPRARPLMKHPNEVFGKKKAAEFDEAGRPFHTLFYTGLPSFYQTLHELTGIIRELDQFADRMVRYSVHQNREKTLSLGGSRWISKEELENLILENLKEKHYNFFLLSMERLVDHPYSYRAKDFIMKFRKSVAASVIDEEIPKLMFTGDGTPYMTASGKRKLSTATATVYGRGSGKITINGESILYFKNLQDREQIIFPLQFSEMLGKVDVVADVEGGGTSAQAGAIRYAISLALKSFVDKETIENMRLAGLLTRDPRKRERKKPGQKGARAKFTWKKR